MHRFSWNTLKHFWQVHLTVALCTAVATGVLAGALIVGDSVRGSLRSLTAERLGTIQHVLLADHFFEPHLLNRQGTVPAVLLNGTIAATQTQTRASKVNILGVTERFFTFWEGEPHPLLGRGNAAPNLNKTAEHPFNAIVMNEALRNELNVQVGDTVLVDMPQAADIHPEFLLGERDASEAIQSLRLVVSDIIPTNNAGRFSLRAHQSIPFNAFIALPVLQKALGQTGKVNALFTAETEPMSPEQLTLTLDALNLNIQIHEDHFDLQSQQYLIKPVLSETALTVATEENDIPILPTFTYLANTISANDKSVPYSTIVAFPMNEGEFSELLSRHTTETALLAYEAAQTRERKRRKTENREELEEIEKDGIVLNAWTAEDLGVKIGDKISLTYYRVGAGEEYITETAFFLLKGILPIEGIAADRALIPQFPGIHDTADIFKWDPPFPIDYSRIRQKDENYWDEYGTTPKAFIPLETGKRLWKNRFGALTTIRMMAAPGRDIQATRTLFETEFLKKIQPEQLGFQFLSVRAAGLQAASGATDFGMLFSSLSLFIILAVAWLVELFFRLGVEQRSREIGILQAVGYPLAKIRRRFLLEGGIIAGIGNLFGCLLAMGYAQLMIFGLHTWWLPAIGTPFIEFHARPWSLLIGVCVPFAVIMYAIRGTVVRIGRVPTASLLAGATDFNEATAKPKSQDTTVSRPRASRIFGLLIGTLLGILGGRELFTDGWSGLITLIMYGVVGVILHLFTSRGKGFLFFFIGLGVGVVIAYFPFGTWILGKVLAKVFAWVGHPISQLLMLALYVLGIGRLAFDRWLNSQNVPKRLSRMRFALKNAARQPGRSKACVTTLSLACCIIVAVGANRHDALPETEYAFVAESALPLHHSLNTPAGRLEFGFSEEDSQLLSTSEVIPFRVLPGEDVSCLNLYQPQKPQILGVSERALNNSPWVILQADLSDANRVVGIGDEKSLRWILHHDADDDFLIQDEFGRTLRIRLHTLENSLFQSQLIISESNFTTYFPSQSGYQFFLIKTPPALREETARVLEKTLDSYGFDITSASARLASYRAVENTYISTFQSLGGLGVLLGTFGLALVLFRNIIERRGELATLRAFGFRRQLLSRMLFLESCFLLAVGMLLGTVAGLVTILGSQGHLPSFPWFSLTITLLFIFGFGIIANAVAVAVALRSPLLTTLKSE